MLKETYKSYCDKIEVPESLITATKEKMEKEKNKNKFSFYKYGTIAACLIIALVITIPYTNSLKNTSDDLSGNIAYDSLNSSQMMDSSFKGDYFSGNVENFVQNSFDPSIESSASVTTNDESIFEKVLNFIINIFSYPIKFISNLFN